MACSFNWYGHYSILAYNGLLDVPSLRSKLLEHSDPYKPLLPYLSHSTNPEDPIPLLTSSILTSLMSNAQMQNSNSTPQTDEALPRLYKYLSGLTKSQDSGLQDIAVQEYSSLLRTRKARELFWSQREETVHPLIDILRTAAGAGKESDSTSWNGGTGIRSATEAALSGGVGLQLLYHVLLTIWQLSFEASLVGKGLERYILPHGLFFLVLTAVTANKSSSSSTRNFYASPLKRRRPAYSSLLFITSSPPRPTDQPYSPSP